VNCHSALEGFVANLNFYAIKVDEPLGEGFKAFQQTDVSNRPEFIERVLRDPSA
jgi:hypothetical protein